MRIETALKRRDAYVSRMREIYAANRISRDTSANLARSAENCISEMRGANLPNWVINFVRGYEYALRDDLYSNHLVFGAYIDGKFYSTDSARPDYYEKLGISASQFAKLTHDGECKTAGHYWIKPWPDGTMRPFFTENDTAKENAK